MVTISIVTNQLTELDEKENSESAVPVSCSE